MVHWLLLLVSNYIHSYHQPVSHNLSHLTWQIFFFFLLLKFASVTSMLWGVLRLKSGYLYLHFHLTYFGSHHLLYLRLCFKKIKHTQIYIYCIHFINPQRGTLEFPGNFTLFLRKLCFKIVAKFLDGQFRMLSVCVCVSEKWNSHLFA
jgi:hypothetical protein